MGPEFFLLGKLFVLITGASRGIGRQLAIKFSQVVQNDSKFLLMARNETGLQETASKMSNFVNVDYVSVDLSIAQADQLSELINESINPNEYDAAIVIHDVGSLGNFPSWTDEMDDFDVWRKMYDLNVFSPAVLNSVSMKIFNNNVKAKKLVINLTSIDSKNPAESVGYYCSAKAAREMYFKVFAKEFPQVNVLNFSPFVVDTQLSRRAAEVMGATEFLDTIKKMRPGGQLLTTTQVANRLVEIIREQKYKSGDFVDYYDEL